MTNPTNEAGHGLPELPESVWLSDVPVGTPLYTADHVQQYAKDYAAALALSRGLPPVEGVRVCDWHQQDEGYDTFSTGCGHEYTVNECTDGNVQLPYCPFCAKPLRGIAWNEDDDISLPDALAAAPAAAGAQGEGQQVQAQAQQRGADSDLPFTTTQRVVRALLHLGHGVPESQEEQYARSNELVLTLCSEVMASTTPQPAAADGGVRARQLLAAELRNIGYPSSAEELAAGAIVEDKNVLGAALRAIEAALSSHRQAGDGLSKFRELAERWRQEAEDNKHLGGSWHRTDLCNTHAEELLALVEKGAGNAD